MAYPIHHMTTQAKHRVEYTQAELSAMIGQTPDVFVLIADLAEEMNRRHRDLLDSADRQTDKAAYAESLKVAEERKTIALVAYFAALKLLKGGKLDEVQHVNLETALEVQDII
jgi:hypothetical protein